MGKAGDTVVTTKGNSTGVVAYVPENAPLFVYSPHLSFWRVVDPTLISADFLRYWARSREFKSQLRAFAGSTDMAPYLSLADQRRLRITLPPLAEQLRIGEVLSSLDAKAEHNEKVAAHLYAFTEIRCSELLSAVGDERPLSAVATFVNGRAFTKEANGAGRPIIRIKELNGGVIAGTPRADIDAAPKNVATAGDLLLSWSGSLNVYRWTGDDALINQHIFKVMPEADFPTWLAEHWVRIHLRSFQAIAADKATTMGHIQRRHLDEAVVSVPSDAALRLARAELDPIDALRCGLLAESHTLRRARDVLLPKLISGEAHVAWPDEAAAAPVEEMTVEVA